MGSAAYRLYIKFCYLWEHGFGCLYVVYKIQLSMGAWVRLPIGCILNSVIYGSMGSAAYRLYIKFSCLWEHGVRLPIGCI